MKPKALLRFALLLCSMPIMCQEPYELKGDKLGSSLADFKQKYHHIPEGDKRSGPPCSDEYPLQNIEASKVGDHIFQGHMTAAQMQETSKQAEELGRAYTAAGLVDCKIYFDFEQIQGKQTTIANVPTSLQLFRFFQGSLYTIFASFDQREFEHVNAAFVEKYGPPSSDTTQSYQNAFGATFQGKTVRWTNGISTLELVERSTDLKSSSVIFLHQQLSKQAEAARPKGKPDL
jgi:hypothetical protein